MTRRYRIRRAVRTDLDAVLALEQRAFTTDHLSRRQYRRHLSSTSAVVLAAVDTTGVVGKAVLFFRSNSAISRLYSIAVDEAARGRGVGQALLHTAERTARERGCDVMRLEVRQENISAIRLYERLGYRPFGVFARFYEDGAHALRYQKDL